MKIIQKLSLILTCCTLVSSTALPANQVWMHVNYPDDVVYANAMNIVEVWIENEYPLTGMSLGFGFQCDAGAFEWISPYGQYPSPVPYMKVDDPYSTSSWNLGGWYVVANYLPLQVLVQGYSSIPELGFPVHEKATRIFSFMLDGSELSSAGGDFCVDDVFIPPNGYWYFNGEFGSLYPDFHPCPNCDPGLPAVCFPIVERNWIGGDADGSGEVSVSDAVFILNYIFAGGSAPVPVSRADTNCDGNTNISDCVYLINFIFSGGSAPC